MPTTRTGPSSDARPLAATTHLLLRRQEDGVVEVLRSEDGTAVEPVARVAADGLADLVAGLEVDHPRWTWDCTTRWYPALLAAGVRVQRCWDLRLSHHLLGHSPLASPAPGPDSAAWDRLQPSEAGATALFDRHDLLGLDVFDELRRQRAALVAADHHGLGLLLGAESAGALVAAEMAWTGLPWRADVHARVLTDQLGPRPEAGARPAVLAALLAEIREAFGAPGLNPDSPASLLAALHGAGLEVEDTRSWTLEQLEHPGIPALLRYKKLARLLTANGWQWLDTWVADGRFRPEYLVGGVVTGRWSSRGGGALMVPAPLRTAVVADDGWRLVIADAAQLEPRVLAGMSGDAAMVEAGRGRDLYQGMVDDGAVATRSEAKLGIIGAMYGGTRGESGRMVARLAVRYPSAFALVEDAARAGERGEVVRTLLGRGSPAPRGAWTEPVPEDGRADPSFERQRRSWGRFTRNFVVQGTAAEWASAWLGLLRNRLWQLGPPDVPLERRPHLATFLHDEVLVHTPAGLADDVAEAVRAAAEDAGRLLLGEGSVDFPLDVHVVGSWAEAG